MIGRHLREPLFIRAHQQHILCTSRLRLRIPTSFNPLKAKRRLFYLETSSYRAVNTFHLGYKNQSVNDA